MANRPKRILCLLVAAALVPGLAMASGVSETFTRTSLLLILMITAADVCGYIFERLGMAEILGEIYAGIMLGNLALIGIDFNLGELLRSSEFMVYSSELAPLAGHYPALKLGPPWWFNDSLNGMARYFDQWEKVYERRRTPTFYLV